MSWILPCFVVTVMMMAMYSLNSLSNDAVGKIPAAFVFSMQQKRGTEKPTDIPPELMERITKSIPYPLTALQQEIMENLQNRIETELKTRRWGGIISEYKDAECRTDIHNSVSLCDRGSTNIVGKMSDLERDCMHQVLLGRRANKYLTIQKRKNGWSDPDNSQRIYAYALDGYDGRASYLDPAINYCKLIHPALDSYKYNPLQPSVDYVILKPHPLGPVKSNCCYWCRQYECFAR